MAQAGWAKPTIIGNFDYVSKGGIGFVFLLFCWWVVLYFYVWLFIL
jgi:hypothetical protein